MSYTLLVNTTPEERRVALVEGSTLREFYTERRYDRGLVGNIYKGRVLRVMPGMDASFVEIGIGKAGFLQDRAPVGDDEPGGASHQGSSSRSPADGNPPPEVGQDLLVQVSRDATGSKGPRMTTELSLAGRTLVFLPRTPVVGVSRRIVDEGERDRLRKAVEGMLPEGSGAVLRTASLERPEEELADDLSFLMSLWERTSRYADDVAAPALVHEDLDLLLRTARDMLTDECVGVQVDSEEDYDRLLQFVDSFMPHLNNLVKLYRDDLPLFESQGLDTAISRLLDRSVWLKSGGSIVIDHTEALTAIDVNTGRYTGRGDPEETVLKTNLEAAREIAEQLRLRNIGGIVVVDFIDMHDPDSRDRVQQVFKDHMSRDKAHSDVMPMSRLGLVELTRKRLREGVFPHMTETCPYCDGRGWIRSVDQVCADIVRKVALELRSGRVRGLRILAHARVVETLIETYRTSLADMEAHSGKPIRLVRMDDLHVEGYSIRRDP